MAELADEVYSLMIPTVDSNILLPNANVAEIVPFSNVELFDDSANKPNWFLGHLLWRGMNIPLISVDVIRGVADPQANKRSRVAIANTLNSNRNVPYLAIVVQGIPRLSHVRADNITAISSPDISEAEKMRVEVDTVSASIPDLDRLEEMVQEHINVA